jgi:predicted Zn-dependent protease
MAQSPIVRPVLLGAPRNRHARNSPFLVGLASFGVVIAGICAYILWFTNSSAVNAAHRLIVQDVRVRDTLGQSLSMPLALGWTFNGESRFFALITTGNSGGFVVAHALQRSSSWEFTRLEVVDQTENYLIDLSPTTTAASSDELHVQGRIYLIALGDSAKNEVNSLAHFLNDDFKVPVKILDPLQLPSDAYDPVRKQWIGDMLVDAMAAKHPDLAADLDAKIIGILDGDMYPRSLGWNFAFNYRAGDKYAVIPAALLDPGSSRRPPSDTIKMDRLRKVVLKIVGLFYFGFKSSNDPSSPMSFEGTLNAVDRQDSGFLISDIETTTKSNIEGTPCLTFSSATVSGVSRLRLVQSCRDHTDFRENGFYEVDLSRGEFRTERGDLRSLGAMPLHLDRLYASELDAHKMRAFGRHTWQNLDDDVWSTNPQSIQVISIGSIKYRRTTPGVGFSPLARYRSDDGRQLTWENGRWRVEDRNGNVSHYLGCGANTPIACFFVDESDSEGDRIAVVRDAVGHIDKVVQTTAHDLPEAAKEDHTWTFAYKGNTIQQISDSDGKTAHYGYDTDSYLTDVEADGHTVHYEYNADHRMNRVSEDGHSFNIHYDAEGRADELDLADNFTYRIKYGGGSVQVISPNETWTVEMNDGFFHLESGKPKM